MTVSRTVKGSHKEIQERFLNELLLQEYLKNLIGGWSILPMFQPVKNRITVNISGIGEEYYDKYVFGCFEYQRRPGNQVMITMKVRKFFHTKFSDYLKAFLHGSILHTG